MPPGQAWSEANLQQLITTGQEESLQLEFKRSTVTDDRAKTEISKDVSAFANTIGGTLLYGIEEHPDPPHKAIRIQPLDPAVISKEWLEQVINSRIQPRISGVRIVSIDLPTNGPGVAYAVEIPESSTAHQAYDKRYYRRFNFQAVMMEDYEIRYAMNRATKPAYQVWFQPYQATGDSMGFNAVVVNLSEITPTIMSATLYVPAAGRMSASQPWEIISMEGINFHRFQATIHHQWNPGRHSPLQFDGALVRLPTVQVTRPLRVHLKLFDDWGLALHEAYDVAIPGLNVAVVFSESDRKAAAIL